MATTSGDRAIKSALLSRILDSLIDNFSLSDIYRSTAVGNPHMLFDINSSEKNVKYTSSVTFTDNNSVRVACSTFINQKFKGAQEIVVGNCNPSLISVIQKFLRIKIRSNKIIRDLGRILRGKIERHHVWCCTLKHKAHQKKYQEQEITGGLLGIIEHEGIYISIQYITKLKKAFVILNVAQPYLDYTATAYKYIGDDTPMKDYICNYLYPIIHDTLTVHRDGWSIFGAYVV